MFFERIYYEIRLLGWRVVLAPLLIMLVYALIAELLHYRHLDPSRFLSSSLEMILPVAVGIMVATLVSHDSAVELQLTLPVRFRSTTLLRLLLISGWSLCVSLIASVVLNILHISILPQSAHTFALGLQFFTGQLTWLVPLLWFTAAGLCISVLLRSRSGSASLLGGIWLFEIIFKDAIALKAWPLLLFPTTLLPLAGPLPQSLYNEWLLNRLVLLVMALLFLIIGWFLLRNTEGLLKGSGEE